MAGIHFAIYGTVIVMNRIIEAHKRAERGGKMTFNKKGLFVLVLIAFVLSTLFTAQEVWAGKKNRNEGKVAASMNLPAPSDPRFLYEQDAGVQNSGGTWNLPNVGSCFENAAIPTRPECVAQHYPSFTTQSACTSAGHSWSTGACEVPSATDQATCESVAGRVWTNGICAVTMKGQNRNLVVCANDGGTWVTTGRCVGNWTMPNSNTYNPPLLTGSTNPGPGDGCLRCHNSQTEWNNTKVRWVETYMKTGHKNMARKVTVGIPWAGPDGTAYPHDDANNNFNWTTGTVNIQGVDKLMYWIYADWLAPFPRDIYATDPVAGSPGVSYSCARCHTTGWTSDAALQANKEPEKSFPGITWDGVTAPVFGQVNLKGGVTGDSNKMASWDQWGIQCTRCHSSLVDKTTNGGVPPFTAPTGYSAHHSELTSADGNNKGGYCSLSFFSNADQATCTAAGGTWYAQCSIPTFITEATCTGGGGTWSKSECKSADGTTSYPQYTSQVTCQDAGQVWYGFKGTRGQIITALCMECHRQETGGLPFDSGTDPAGMLKVSSYHNTITFPSHYHGNQYLNSPHAKFTGTTAQIGTAKLFNGYNSYFLADGEARNTGNGCTGCHDVHKSVVKEAGQMGAIKEECMECHSKNLNLMRHPGGVGTPLEHMNDDEMETCVSCHMPGGLHLFRVNSSDTYSTFPAAAMGVYTTSTACTGAGGTWASNTCYFNANQQADGTYTKAVWVDVDLACGQCHGGGTASQVTTGSIAAGTQTLTVADPTNLATGNRIRIPGAGALGADWDTFVSSVSGTTVTLVAKATTTVNNVTVTQGPTTERAGYMTKSQLADYAKGIHNDGPSTYFTVTLGNPNTLIVNVNASGSTCGGSNANCDAYDWNWGDGSATDHGVTATHTYATAGSKTITLTVHDYGVGEATTSRQVNVYAPDSPPVASGTCTFNANQWTFQIVDSSTDDHGISLVSINWGDGTLVSNGGQGQTFNHTFLNAGSYTIRHKVVDNIGQQNTRQCFATPAYFTISGTVFKSDHVTPVPTAMVRLQMGTTNRIVYTASNGTFTVGTLKPGTYTVTVTKSGYTFAVPAATITVGPSSSGNNIYAIAP